MDEYFNIILKILIGIGIPTMIGASIYIGRKLQILDNLEKNNKTFCQNTTNAIVRITNAIVEIQTHLTGKGFAIKQRLAYTSNSPLNLTDYGEILMEESGFNDIIGNSEKREYLIKLVITKQPKTNYDIQQFSMDTMAELVELNDPAVIPLKNYAYKKGLNLEIILNSAGIVLRDEIMKEFKFDDKV